MKVKDLIEELQKFDENAIVLASFSDGDGLEYPEPSYGFARILGSNWYQSDKDSHNATKVVILSE